LRARDQFLKAFLKKSDPIITAQFVMHVDGKRFASGAVTARLDGGPWDDRELTLDTSEWESSSSRIDSAASNKRWRATKWAALTSSIFSLTLIVSPEEQKRDKMKKGDTIDLPQLAEASGLQTSKGCPVSRRVWPCSCRRVLRFRGGSRLSASGGNCSRASAQAPL
jgi:hypothetical protein